VTANQIKIKIWPTIYSKGKLHDKTFWQIFR